MITRTAWGMAAITWIAVCAAVNASAQDVSRFAGTWTLESVSPRAKDTDSTPALLTIDVSGRLVTVTSTVLGGSAGMRTTVDRYELDGTERPLKTGSPARTTRTGRRAPGGFEVIETVTRGADTVQRATDRWSISSTGRLTIDSATNGRSEKRRTYRRR